MSVHPSPLAENPDVTKHFLFFYVSELIYRAGGGFFRGCFGVGGRDSIYTLITGIRESHHLKKEEKRFLLVRGFSHKPPPFFHTPMCVQIVPGNVENFLHSKESKVSNFH